MLYLILAVACSSGNALTIKYAEKKTGNRIILLLVNYIVAVIAGAGFMIHDGKGFMSAGSGIGQVLAMGCINGALYILTFILLQVNIIRNGATVSASLSHMGLLIPVLLSILVFREYPDGMQTAGTVIALAAIILISIPAASDSDGAAGPRWLLIPMLISSGMADMMSKLFAAYCSHSLESAFMQVTFTVALLICCVCALYRRERVNRHDVILGTILGVLNYMSVKLLIRALYVLPAFFVYVSYGTGVILLINVVNAVIMHEKLSRRDYVSMVLIVAAIILLNL